MKRPGILIRSKSDYDFDSNFREIVTVKNAYSTDLFHPSESQKKNCYRPQTKLGQGNMFTGVCLSTGGCLVQGGVETQPPPRRLLLRAVYILLECILVIEEMATENMVAFSHSENLLLKRWLLKTF